MHWEGEKNRKSHENSNKNGISPHYFQFLAVGGKKKQKKTLAPTRDKQHPQNKDRSQSKRVKNIQRRGSEYDGFSTD